MHAHGELIERRAFESHGGSNSSRVPSMEASEQVGGGSKVQRLCTVDRLRDAIHETPAPDRPIGSF
jgi:hypothetical protein